MIINILNFTTTCGKIQENHLGGMPGWFQEWERKNNADCLPVVFHIINQADSKEGQNHSKCAFHNH